MHLIHDGPRDAASRLVLAHGAGAGIDSPFMCEIAGLLAMRGIAITRLEFAYMAQRTGGGSRRPPPKVELLAEEYRAALDEIGSAAAPEQRIFIGGKSMGGRVASLAASDLFRKSAIRGLVCLGYPFHPPRRHGELRTAHLVRLDVPTLIVQGERDPFGTRAEVEVMSLSPMIGYHWALDGNHDLAPRRKSGHTADGNLAAAADAIVSFISSSR